MKDVKILFVDDNPVNLIAAENLISTFGFKINKADSGKSAIQLAMQEEYDLIFVDLLMPEMDGILTTQLIRKLLRDDVRTKIIATSGVDLKDYNEDRQLFDGKIQKPLNLDMLKSCFTEWLGIDCLPSITTDHQEQMFAKNWKEFVEAIVKVKGLNVDYLLEFSNRDVAYFVRLISSSLKQISQAIGIMKSTIVDNEDKLAHEQLHALKSVLYYVGAHNLSHMAQNIDNMLVSEKDQRRRTQKFIEQMGNYLLLIRELEEFCHELEQAMNAYNRSIKNYQDVLSIDDCTVEELNKCIEQILYHIDRFEYIEILNGLNYLKNMLSINIKPYINQAISALEEFDYEKVESLLRDCWNEAQKSL